MAEAVVDTVSVAEDVPVVSYRTGIDAVPGTAEVGPLGSSTTSVPSGANPGVRTRERA